MNFFRFVGACCNEPSKSGILKFIGKGCSYVVLSLISWDRLVRFGSRSEVISKSHVNGEIHNQTGNLVITCGHRF